jgi:hypothetical protein
MKIHRDFLFFRGVALALKPLKNKKSFNARQRIGILLAVADMVGIMK